jgi:hypothetical protein
MTAKKSSPDGSAVAIRTKFTDEPMGLLDQTKSWLIATYDGTTGYMTEAEVADWPDLTEGA